MMSDETKDYSKLLKEPFEESEIEWRVQRSGLSGKKGWAIVIPYLTNRAVQERLDEVFGVDGWENSFQATQDGKGYLCGIKAKFGDKWITKWDGAEYTNVEALKGGLSSAMKRTAIQFGIGRYLYNFDEQFVTCSEVENQREVTGNYIFIRDKKSNQSMKAQWFTPDIPKWAMPSVKAENFSSLILNSKTLDELKANFKTAHHYATSFKHDDLKTKFISEKDQVKEKLIEEENIRTMTISARVNDWLIDEINTGIVTANNESVLNMSKDTIKGNLIIKCRDEGIDNAEFLNALREAYESKLGEFK